MIGRELAILNFDRVFSYAVRVSSRYKRCLSLIMLSGPPESEDVSDLLSGRVRRCDEVLEFQDCAAVLMGETSQAGALLAVQRLKQECTAKPDLRFGVASFPEDGEVASKLLLSARRRLEMALGQHPGAVVAAG